MPSLLFTAPRPLRRHRWALLALALIPLAVPVLRWASPPKPRTITRVKPGVSLVGFSPDGRWALTSRYDYDEFKDAYIATEVRDAETWAVRFDYVSRYVLGDNSLDDRAPAFSRDGRFLVAASKRRGPIEPHVVYGADGARVLEPDLHDRGPILETLKTWELATGRVTFAVEVRRPRGGVEYRLAEERPVLAYEHGDPLEGEERRITVVDYATGRIVAESGGFEEFALSPDGRFLAASPESREDEPERLLIFALPEMAPRVTIAPEMESGPASLVFSDDGRYLAVLSSEPDDEGRFEVFEAATGRRVAWPIPLVETGPPWFSERYGHLFPFGSPPAPPPGRLWDLHVAGRRPSQRAWWEPPGPVQRFAIETDEDDWEGHYDRRYHGRIHVVDRASGRALGGVGVVAASKMALSRDGRTLAVADRRDPSTGFLDRLLDRILPSSLRPRVFSWNEDVDLYHVRTGWKLAGISRRGVSVQPRGLWFTPDGKSLVVESNQTTSPSPHAPDAHWDDLIERWNVDDLLFRPDALGRALLLSAPFILAGALLDARRRRRSPSTQA